MSFPSGLDVLGKVAEAGGFVLIALGFVDAADALEITGGVIRNLLGQRQIYFQDVGAVHTGSETEFGVFTI